MKIVINGKAYTDIKNINFDPKTDITSRNVTINEFSAELKTNDNIAVGQYAYLRDNNDQTWAKYWIVEAEKYTDSTITVYCQSELRILDQVKLSAIMYQSAGVIRLLTELFEKCGIIADIDENLDNISITGFAPEQTARERLQWLCFVAGAYIQTEFTETVKIRALSSSVALPVFSDRVYYRPSVQYSDWITGIRLYAYNYFEGSPGRTDEYVQDERDGIEHTYVQSKLVYFVENPDAPETAPENIVEIAGVTIIDYGSNSTTADEILNRLARYYFKRVEVSADIINNGDISSGNQCILDDGTGQIVTGFIGDCNFTFGKNHKSSIVISQGDVSQGTELVILAVDDGEEIARDVFYLPSGYIYNIQNRYIFITGVKETESGSKVYAKTLYRPQNTSAHGTVGENTTTNTQEYDIALENKQGKLLINIVDSITETESGKVAIG